MSKLRVNCLVLKFEKTVVSEQGETAEVQLLLLTPGINNW